MGYVDLRRLVPELRGSRVYVLPAEAHDRLTRVLSDQAFQTYTLDGARIRDKAGFMQEAARSFAFPAYFGANWDALDECLRELSARPARRIAIVWTQADVCLGADVQTFVDGVLAFESAAVELVDDAEDTDALQVEVFILGAGAHFSTR